VGVREMITMQVRCHSAARELQAYLDGEADAGSSRMVAAHLEECRRCGLEGSAFAAIKAAIGSGRDAGQPVEMDPLVLARLERFASGLSRTEGYRPP